MAEYKCSNCGAKIVVSDGESVIHCSKCNFVQSVYLGDIQQNASRNNYASNRESVYNSLCKKMCLATTNNEFLSLFDGFKNLGDFRDSVKKCKQCLDKLSFSNADELLYLGNSYKDLHTTESIEVGKRCIAAANQWKQYEDDYAAFYSAYDGRPQLLKLWEKYSTLIIIVGLVTLLWGFIIYFGAVLIEFIVRFIVTKIKRNSEEYKIESERLTVRKQAIDSLLYDLRNR